MSWGSAQKKVFNAWYSTINTALLINLISIINLGFHWIALWDFFTHESHFFWEYKKALYFQFYYNEILLLLNVYF